MLAALAIRYLGAAYGVYRDACRHGSDQAALCGVAALFFGLLGIAVHLMFPPEPRGAIPPPTRTDRLVVNLVVASVLTFLVPPIVGPPDPFTRGYQAALALPGRPWRYPSPSDWPSSTPTSTYWRRRSEGSPSG